MTRQGYRAFLCECGTKWKTPCREHTSPSKQPCPTCGGEEAPIAAWPDPSLPVDQYGNLVPKE